MNRKLILCCLVAGLSFSGCKKLHSLFHKKTGDTKPASETVAATAPAPKPVVKAEPVAPAPTPRASINKSAAVIALCYHNIEDGKSNALTISTTEFQKEMQALKDNGFTVIGMQDFLAWRRGEKDIPAKCALITIDDGWISAHDNAWPILKKFDYPFTLFIYINYVNSGGKSMSWDQLGEMRDAGVDIECHTYSHSDLKRPGLLVDKRTADMVRKDIAALGQDGWLRKEVVESKQVLEKQLGIKVNAFAYPFGIYNEKVLAMVKEAGYEAAFTVYGQQLRLSSPYDRLGRYAIVASKPEIFNDAIKMIGGGVIGTPAPAPDVAQLASASMVTQPMDGETIGNATPVIKANLATLGTVDPGSVKMRISGIGAVPAKYDATSKNLTYAVGKKLTEKSYTVIVTATSQGKRIETQWSFNFDPTGKHVGPAPTAPLPPRQ
jgi:peptidoglycan/xylan/chitin deacetylase (PgdA/CDA1 family)